MTYQETLDYIWSLVNFETTSPQTRAPYRLERMGALLERLGNPQERFRSIHIAGTKGKGSTSAMVEQVLRSAGYRTGLYTSPHLHSPRERIRVAGEPVTQQAFIDLLERVRPHMDALGNVTTFETLTAMAFVAFVAAEVEVAVVEVGLGGRLDATNFITPLVSIITPLALEHTVVLGDTIEEIAFEKGGIIKPGVPVVTADQPQEGLEVLRNLAVECGSPFVVASERWRVRLRESSLSGQLFDLESRVGANGYTKLHLSLPGTHQSANARVVVSALHAARSGGLVWDEPALRAGLAAVQWPARVEVMGTDPLIVVDGAHTPSSADALVETLRQAVPEGWRSATLILGVSSDKEIGELFERLAPVADRLLLTRSRHPRAADPEQLARHPAIAGRELRVVPGVAEAVRLAREEAAPDTLIVVAGSLFVAAEARYALLPASERPLD